MIYLYYILGFATGYVIRGIVCDVKRRLTEYPILQAMQAQQTQVPFFMQNIQKDIEERERNLK